MIVKAELQKACRSIVENRIALLDKEMEVLQQASNEETKSSAGDKYETGRAMMMLEKEKIAGQREQALQQLKALAAIDLGKEFKNVESGALVQTQNATYFVCAAIGKVDIGEGTYLVISPMAPIAQLMLGKEIGESFSLNSQHHKILGIA